ncbi:MAG: glucosamine-6-phosphate deaminase [Bacteroidetes bacterium]|nr:MAG: glucosamine-6-phosphate deaminase [Bacteroidota bacterium]
MNLHIFPDKQALGRASGQRAAELIRAAIRQAGRAHLLLATGASQFETLAALTAAKDIDWSQVVMFHLDEYLGLPATHPASFRAYLQQRFVQRVGPLRAVHFIQGDAPDAQAECERISNLIRAHPIDVALVGIGENGHLAFNDPPADMETEAPYIRVNLDEACRRQQLGEGWFASLEEVPRQAISMSVQQILKSKHILCSVPDARKAQAVKMALEGPIGEWCAASALQAHPQCEFFLDKDSAALLSESLKA